MVLFFDSGLGGRTIEQAFQEACPDVVTAYLCDRENLPYGDKSDAFIIESVNKLVNNFVNKSESVDCLVIACNTASTLVLPSLRAKYDFPIVGVVPAIKPAAQLSKTGHVALLATEGTVKRDYTQQLIDDFATDCEIHRFASHSLVSLAERYCEQEGSLSDDDWAKLNHEVAAILEKKNVDTVVLACTHFSYFKEHFETLAPHVTWIDSVDAVVRQIQKVLLVKQGTQSTSSAE